MAPKSVKLVSELQGLRKFPASGRKNAHTNIYIFRYTHTHTSLSLCLSLYLSLFLLPRSIYVFIFPHILPLLLAAILTIRGVGDFSSGGLRFAATPPSDPSSKLSRVFLQHDLLDLVLIVGQGASYPDSSVGRALKTTNPKP